MKVELYQKAPKNGRKNKKTRAKIKMSLRFG
nr:MAG TPA: hypothetical protein [Caudoviricetes sp.]DAU13960.1 MAG TPA: hypothetical protein [Bacteriophage sp.]